MNDFLESSDCEVEAHKGAGIQLPMVYPENRKAWSKRVKEIFENQQMENLVFSRTRTPHDNLICNLYKTEY